MNPDIDLARQGTTGVDADCRRVRGLHGQAAGKQRAAGLPRRMEHVHSHQ